MILDILIGLMVLGGAAFVLLGSIGLARLPDFFMRLHGPTKATTLGLGAFVIASLLHVGAEEGAGGLRELAVALFLFITAPITAHLLSKAALAEERRRKAAQARASLPGNGTGAG